MSKKVYTSKPNTLEKLLSSPARWTKGSFAKNNKGKQVSFSSPDACRWCLAGAINYLYPNNILKQDSAYNKLSSRISKMTQNNCWDVVEFNDARTTCFKDIQKIVKGL